MRLSTAALRALRATRPSALAAARVPRIDSVVRPLCVASTSGTTTTSTTTTTEQAAAEAKEIKIDVESPSSAAPIAESVASIPIVDDADPEATASLATSDADVSAEASAASGDESTDERTDELVQESLITDTHTDSVTAEVKADQTNDDFLSPSFLGRYKNVDEFFDHITRVAPRNPIRAMLLTRSAMQQPGSPFIDERVWQYMLPIMSRNNWGRSVRDLMKIVEEKEFEVNAIRYNCVLFTMYRDNNPETYDKMKAIIDKMHSLPRYAQPNATTYNLLIASLFYCGSVEDAFEVVNTMKELGINPTAATYQTLISGCLKRREYDSAFDTIMLCEHNGMHLGALPYAQVLYLAARGDKYDQMVKLLSRLDNVLPVYHEYLERVQQRRNTFNHKDTVLDITDRGEPKLELSIFYAVLQSCARGARPDIAINAWNLFKQTYPDRKPTKDMWISLIGALAMAGDHNAALDGLAHMRADGYETKLKEFMTFLIKPIGNNISKIDEIYYYLIDCVEGSDKAPPPVEDDGPQPEIVDETPAASASIEKMDEDASEKPKSSGHISLREEIGLSDIGSTMRHYGLPWADQPRPPVSITDFNIIISACAVAGDIDRAFQTYDEACGRLGMQRDDDTLFSLLEGCVQVGHIRGGMRVLDEARVDNCLFTPDMIHMACRLYCRSARTPKAYDLIKEADENNHPILMRTFEMVARHLFRSGLNEESDEIVSIGVKNGFRQQIITPHAFKGNKYHQRANRRQRYDRESVEDEAPQQQQQETVKMES